MQQSERREKLGLAIYAAGFIVALTMAVIAVWGLVESVMFDPSLTPEVRLRTLRCPVIMTIHEETSVKATFSNPSERSVRIPIRTRVTHGRISLMREVSLILPLGPGEAETLEWRVSSEDMVFGRFILVRVHGMRSAPLPSRGGSCGIMVLDVPYVTGNQILVGSLLFSLVATVVGGRLWLVNARAAHRRTQRPARTMVLLVVIVFVALVAALLGYWAIGMLALIFILILLGALLENYLAQSIVP
jgi:hypothetical protein